MTVKCKIHASDYMSSSEGKDDWAVMKTVQASNAGYMTLTENLVSLRLVRALGYPKKIVCDNGKRMCKEGGTRLALLAEDRTLLFISTMNDGASGGVLARGLNEAVGLLAFSDSATIGSASMPVNYGPYFDGTVQNAINMLNTHCP